MDFLDDLDSYNQSMENAYLLVTKEKTLDDIYEELEQGMYTKFYLPFDPLQQDGRNDSTLDLLIEHFSSLEEYEKCVKLTKIKNKCSKTRTESDLLL